MHLQPSHKTKRNHFLAGAGGLILVIIIAASVFALLKAQQSHPIVSSNNPAVSQSSATAQSTPDKSAIPIPPPQNYCSANASGKLLLVSISKQRLWACEGNELQKESAVTTGITTNPNGVDDNTPVGTWTILNKQTNLNIRGSDANGSWNEHVDYWLPFIRNEYGFHDAAWQTFAFGDETYHTDGSRGCVHLPIEVMAWVYHWSAVGTTMVTIQS